MVFDSNEGNHLIKYKCESSAFAIKDLSFNQFEYNIFF